MTWKNPAILMRRTYEHLGAYHQSLISLMPRPWKLAIKLAVYRCCQLPGPWTWSRLRCQSDFCWSVDENAVVAPRCSTFGRMTKPRYIARQLREESRYLSSFCGVYQKHGAPRSTHRFPANGSLATQWKFGLEHRFLHRIIERESAVHNRLLYRVY